MCFPWYFFVEIFFKFRFSNKLSFEWWYRNKFFFPYNLFSNFRYFIINFFHIKTFVIFGFFPFTGKLYSSIHKPFFIILNLLVKNFMCLTILCFKVVFLASVFFKWIEINCRYMLWFFNMFYNVITSTILKFIFLFLDFQRFINYNIIFHSFFFWFLYNYVINIIIF